MIRSMLKFVGSASAVVWAGILMGAFFSTSASASPTVAQPLGSCQNCYACSANLSSCVYTGVGRGCSGNPYCSCIYNNGNPICSGGA